MIAVPIRTYRGEFLLIFRQHECIVERLCYMILVKFYCDQLDQQIGAENLYTRSAYVFMYLRKSFLLLFIYRQNVPFILKSTMHFS